MNPNTLPLIALSAAIGGALLSAPAAALADCAVTTPATTAPVAASPVTVTPVTTAPVTDTPVSTTPATTAPINDTSDGVPVSPLRLPSRIAPTPGTATAQALATSTATTTATASTGTSSATATASATGGSSTPGSTACTQDAWGAPMAAQGLHRVRSSLAQTLSRALQARSDGSTSAGTRYYALASDQSRREGGNTSASALRVSRADLTVGADHRISDQWAAGGAIGMGAPRMRWAGNTTRVDGSGGNATAYGSFSPSSASYVAAALSAESTRYTLHTDDSSSGTDGARATGINTGLSVSAGYDFALGNITLSPFGRVDRVTSRISSFAPGSSASKGRSVSISAGSQVQTTVPTSWGLIAPHARVELTRVNSWHIEGDSATAYAGNNGLLPSPNPTAIDRQYGQFGVGASALMQGGVSLFSDYDQGFAQKGVSSWRFTLGLRAEL